VSDNPEHYLSDIIREIHISDNLVCEPLSPKKAERERERERDSKSRRKRVREAERYRGGFDIHTKEGLKSFWISQVSKEEKY